MIKTVDRCPGLYCGRTILENLTLSDCGACLRGFRTNESFICSPCEKDLSKYDWLYLGFMTILPLIIHWFCIDINAKKRNFTKGEVILHLSAFFEVTLSAFLTILFTDPVWELKINSCGVNKFSDWYTLFHNPAPNYDKTLYCTQEAVYPLQTMIFVFYLFCVTLMMIIRPGLNARFLPQRGKMAVYYALYIFPILSLLHAVAGGLIYYSFPYLSIVISVVSNAFHFSIKLDQSMKSLIKTSVTQIRNVIIIVGHWLLLAYGIISIPNQITMFSLLLVPIPALFYIFTAKYTHPENFK
uniref:Putative conserved plasma membrane protein n=1 Tax=Corethrella appendiculata TaxID=1370023 RepID=U5EYB0_9DIPT